MFVVPVLAARERVLTSKQADVDVIASPQRRAAELLVKRVLPFVYERLFAIEADLMDIGDRLLEIDDLLLAIDYLLGIVEAIHTPTILRGCCAISEQSVASGAASEATRAHRPTLDVDAQPQPTTERA